MGKKYKFKNRLEAVAHFIDLPPEAVVGSTAVHTVSANYCTVENFRSIPVLTDTTVVLICAEFDITVNGEGITAQELSQGMVVLKGNISSVEYKRK